MRNLEADALHPAHSEKSGEPVDSWHVQGALMLLNYREQHKHDGLKPPAINLIYPDQNDTDVTLTAGEEWVAVPENGNSSFAQRFHDYVALHPRERIDMHDEEALLDLLMKLASTDKPTLH